MLATNVECPSLSPDGTRIAFKERVDGGGSLAGGASPIVWQIKVLDLADMSRTAIGLETRSVDDQIEWFDDETVMYEHTTEGEASPDLWLTRIDAGEPKLYLEEASSPAVASVQAGV